MRRVIEVGAGILTAVLAAAVLARIHPLAGEVINPFVVLALLVGFIRGEIAGAWAGMAGGLVADALSLGLFGVAGIALTTAGFLAGFVSRKINVLSLGRLLGFFLALSAVSLGLWMGLAGLIYGRPGPWSGGLILVQPGANAVLAAALERALAGFRKARGR
ncbi:MAG: hypothetical protein FJY82_10675 [Candidatus Aminicenantes bacterium]|nr:hypothetical protein [Candidatus Aminicenantes bacterium]